MNRCSKPWGLALGLALLAFSPANAQVTEGIVSVTQAHMS
jgi:hypothetical protein